MGLRLFWRFDSDLGTITANSTTAGFPIRNVQRGTLSSKHKSDGSQATDTRTIDLGAALPISAFFLGGHDYQSGDTLTLRYASDSGFTADVGTISPTYRAGTLIEFFTPVTRRYWREENLKDVAAETRSAGRLLLGDHTEMSYALRLGYGSGIRSDTSKRIRTEGGQQYTDIRVSLKGQRGSLIVTEAEKVELEALRETYGTAFPFVSALDWENDPLAKTLYGFFASLGEPVDTGVDHWTYSWDMVEQK